MRIVEANAKRGRKIPSGIAHITDDNGNIFYEIDLVGDVLKIAAYRNLVIMPRGPRTVTISRIIPE